ncbi:two-component regulator propeller domain-containing protein [Parachitinimonas caeni]|uniref:histidine kinase n=1 Tax=Parachitinimonas caeni TaxID=3031301 RepID=A0ABT7E320_9NEIS|nr:two-component regulator propeller domain-containing protein [Parachitinimonas caeni]MDK2126723.1 two-component regulator propeller domain-containing protein [Parachitinimonas caeni]
MMPTCLPLLAAGISRVPRGGRQGRRLMSSAIWLLGGLLLVCGLWSGLARAQSGGERWSVLADTVFRHLSRDDGLPHPIVTALAQDQQGYIWVGTQGGLARFDGYRLKVFQPLPSESGALPGNIIRTLHLDRRGRLWVGFYGAGVARYDPATERFLHFPSAHFDDVFALASDANGLWIGSRNGLYWLDFRNDAISPVRPDGASPPVLDLLQSMVRSLVIDQEGGLWVGGNGGLLRWPQVAQLRTAGAARPPTPGTPEIINGVPRVWSTQLDAKGRVWYGTERDGAGWVGSDGVARPVLVGEDPQLRGVSVACITEIGPDLMWLGTTGSGIIELSPDGRHRRKIGMDAALRQGLESNSINALLRDRSGLIWVASVSGLDWHNPATAGIVSVLASPLKPMGLSDRDVLSIHAGTGGRFYLGSRGKGIEVLQVSPQRPAIVHGLPVRAVANSPALESQFVLSVIEINPNQLWAATFKGLYRIDLGQEATATRVPLPLSNPFVRVRSFARTDDYLWIGTEEGLVRMGLSDGQTQTYRANPQSPDGLLHNVINVLYRDPLGELWIGTDGGLNQLLPDGRFRAFRHVSTQSDSLCHNNISSLATDGLGRLWVGSFGGGVCMLDNRDGTPRFRQLTRRSGLPHDNIGTVLADRKGRIWASTADGLAMIDPRTFRIQTFGPAEGVSIRGYWVHSGDVTEDGELLFGGLGGLTVVRPDQLQPWSFSPPLVVSSLRLGGQPRPVPQANALGEMPELALPPTIRGFEVEYAALDFSAPEKNRYQHKLEGYDPAWIETDATRRVAAYSNLPPGNYRLLIRGSNRSGEWVDHELVMPLRILPAWHQTGWFTLAMAALAILAISGVIGARTRVLRRRQMVLEQQVSERTSALTRANETLARSTHTLRQLGDIGKDLTRSLEHHAICMALHKHLASLLPLDAFGVAMLTEAGDGLRYIYFQADGVISACTTVFPLDHPTSQLVQAFREDREVHLVSDSQSQCDSELVTVKPLRSRVYRPLSINQQRIGVVTVQSHEPDVYHERELDVLRSVATYATIALTNASAFDAARAAQREEELARVQAALALEELRQTQAHLVQQEKMAALGQLVANVAHEINTPIGAVKSSGKSVADALDHALHGMTTLFQTLDADNAALFLALLECAWQPAAVQTSREERARVRELMQQLEAAGIDSPRNKASLLAQMNIGDTLGRFVPLLLHPQSALVLETAYNVAITISSIRNINTAVDRVSKIVFALKSFSRVDHIGEWVKADLAEGLDTVLMLYQNQIKQNTELVREFEALPPIRCLPDELNQVWTNLIHNALQAMRHKGTLTIRLYREADWAVVSIADTGSGIAPEIRERIFEPFFTTKAAGEGSGLGLDIVRKIIERHGGWIKVESEVGKGSEFKVLLPINV